jgi:hypothetical protein
VWQAEGIKMIYSKFPPCLISFLLQPNQRKTHLQSHPKTPKMTVCPLAFVNPHNQFSILSSVPDLMRPDRLRDFYHAVFAMDAPQASSSDFPPVFDVQPTEIVDERYFYAHVGDLVSQVVGGATESESVFFAEW